ncbi:MAG: YjjG family noncanonical pyrimidine nucleotidase [Lachnospiraceae bacterium]|nr:YjjG family noncanonical pyrimidine nucleotidase [Lachnospiraceae bacterium]
MIKTILWDVDGTLLDFSRSESCGIRSCLEEIGFRGCNDAMLERYARINDRYWKALERGEVTKQEVLLGRFETFFREEGISCEDVAAFNDSYQRKLGELFFENENAIQLCRKLHGRAAQYVVTNGTVQAQKNKLKNSGLGECMDGVFISDEIGVEKPGKGFFDHVFAEIGPVNRDEVMIVGDSLTSDMRGGNNAGILCCWYNPQNKPNTAGVRIDYEIRSLWDVEKILG